MSLWYRIAMNGHNGFRLPLITPHAQNYPTMRLICKSLQRVDAALQLYMLKNWRSKIHDKGRVLYPATSLVEPVACCWNGLIRADDVKEKVL